VLKDHIYETDLFLRWFPRKRLQVWINAPFRVVNRIETERITSLTGIGDIQKNLSSDIGKADIQRAIQEAQLVLSNQQYKSSVGQAKMGALEKLNPNGFDQQQFQESIRRYNLENEKPIGLVIVDYLQLMSTSKDYDSMVNQVTEISRSLKALAKEFNVPVVALSQLSRAVEARGGKPRLSDLRDSGSIEQDADVVMFLHREKHEEDGFGSYDLDVLIEKHRNGPTGEVKLKFDAKKMSFTDVAKGFDDFSFPTMPAFDPNSFS
jgi:replicative DNA helicase